MFIYINYPFIVYSKEPLASRTELERKAMLIERAREIKWLKMLNNWDKAVQTDKVNIVILDFKSIVLVMI